MTEIIGAHLVGSAPVAEPNQLFQLVHDHLSDHLRRVPDGEVGENAIHGFGGSTPNSLNVLNSLPKSSIRVTLIEKSDNSCFAPTLVGWT